MGGWMGDDVRLTSEWAYYVTLRLTCKLTSGMSGQRYNVVNETCMDYTHLLTCYLLAVESRGDISG
jgi:hypothetical protein